MNDPVRRDAYGAPIDNRQSDNVNPGEPQFDGNWDEGASAFPLAYAWPEDAPAPDYAAEQEAADIEATLLSDLEAAATAFWTDVDPDDDAAAQSADGPVPPDAERGQFEFHWDTTAEDLVGPEARRTLIAFRPPRRRRHDTARISDAELPAVNFDVHATPDGAFADDLAARNKEFYDLLTTNSSARKIAAPPGAGRGPRFESVFPRAEPAPRPHRAAPGREAGTGLMRQAAAAAILAVVVGAGLFIIAQQFAIPEDSLAALPDEAPATAATEPAASSDPVETASISAPDTPKAIDDQGVTAAPSVDPGTLTTPPLYENAEPAGGPADFSDPASPAPEFAAIPLRTETETAAVETVPTASERAPLIETPAPPEESTPPEATAKPQRESVAIAPASPAPTKETPGTTQMLRIPAGTGKVNSAVNMRAGPDNDAKVVRVLNASTPVEIVSCKMWCEIVAGGSRGFVFQRFITRTGGSARTEPAAPAPGDAVTAALPEKSEVAPREEASGPLNLLRFGRPNN